MTINEIADAFDMNLGQFCALLGYTKQALYVKHTGKGSLKGKSAIKLLTMKSDAMLAVDNEVAQKKHEIRANAIRELEKILVGVSDEKS